MFTDPRFYAHQIVDEGQLVFASGGAAVAWVDATDIAAVAERELGALTFERVQAEGRST